MKRFLFAALAICAPSVTLGLTGEDLRADGYRVLECRFTERCLIGTACERAWRDTRWYLKDEDGLAYRQFDNGRLRKGLLMLDARWKDLSEARSIILPLREAVASHMTVFDDGTAVYSMQYAGGPGSGQFFRGTCEAAP